MGAPRQVLIPGTKKQMPHPWRLRLMAARGQLGDLDDDRAYLIEADDAQRERVQHLAARSSRRRNRAVAGPGYIQRNPSRINRLRKNGRLRKELR